MKFYLRLLLLVFFISCGSSNSQIILEPLRENLLIDKGIFKISYNEVYEQPNWIEYSSKNWRIPVHKLMNSSMNLV